MKFLNNQQITIVYGTKAKINAFLKSNIQEIEEDRE